MDSNKVRNFLETKIPPLLFAEVKRGSAGILGGVIRSICEGASPHDIDLFIFDEQKFRQIVATMGGTVSAYSKVLYSTIHHDDMDVDLVYKPGVSSAAAALSSIDFDVAAAVYSAGQIIMDDGFESAIASRVIKFRNPSSYFLDPIDSYERSKKYESYGYTLDEVSFAILYSKYQECCCI